MSNEHTRAKWVRDFAVATELELGAGYSVSGVVGDILGLCGCGDPGSIIQGVTHLLELYHVRHYANMQGGTTGDWEAHSDKIRALLGVETDQAWCGHFIEHRLDALGWTEHGSSVGGSWLTEQGEKVLELLQRMPEEVENEWHVPAEVKDD